MAQQSLGLIETIGLTAAVEAADAAVKSANVTLVGYELSKGDGMTMVKVQGDVGSVNAAIAAATAAAGKIGRVVSTRVIARPADGLERLINTPDTVGFMHSKPTPPPPPCAPEPAPVCEASSESSLSETASCNETPSSEASEAEADDEPHEVGLEEAPAGAEITDSQKKRKKKK